MASQPSACKGQEDKEGGSGLAFARGGAHPPADAGVAGAGGNHLHQGSVLLLPPPPLIPLALKEETSDGGKKQTGEKDSSACLVNQQEPVIPVAEEKETTAKTQTSLKDAATPSQERVNITTKLENTQ